MRCIAGILLLSLCVVPDQQDAVTGGAASGHCHNSIGLSMGRRGTVSLLSPSKYLIGTYLGSLETQDLLRRPTTMQALIDRHVDTVLLLLLLILCRS